MADDVEEGDRGAQGVTLLSGGISMQPLSADGTLSLYYKSPGREEKKGRDGCE